ncbi:hypothetical protein PRZ48_007886 [Zasmidium cellare]|uniref:AB hydrolase-1 domain-containing protein n=1 Tax=Zasmidium cellare TaxID=395010 RepID=A0ABR0ELF1_ZASCE|nr:hypothetical protein PRZ48_007886 [Zasmidium cellare]
MGDRETTFKDDVDAAREAIMRETSLGRDVVVIAHSFGGMVGNSAIQGLTRSKSQKVAENSAGGAVIGLILIASGFTLTGLSFMDPMFGIPPPSWKANRETGFADLVKSPRELFYHDLSAEDAEYWISQLGSQNLKAMFEGGEHAYAGWKDVPTWYIGTIEDRGLPVMVQRMQVGMARAMGGDIVHQELKSSHSPFLSIPDECFQRFDSSGRRLGFDMAYRSALVAFWGALSVCLGGSGAFGGPPEDETLTLSDRLMFLF